MEIENSLHVMDTLQWSFFLLFHYSKHGVLYVPCFCLFVYFVFCCCCCCLSIFLSFSSFSASLPSFFPSFLSSSLPPFLPNCEAVMWRQAESGGSLMDLRWQHLRHWSEKERKSETVTATDPRGEEERDIIKLSSRNFLPLPIMEAGK